MSTFAATLLKRVEGYIELRRSLGYGFRKQATTLRAFQRYVSAGRLRGPLTQDMALAFSLASGETANGRECRYGVLRRFSEYLAPCTIRAPSGLSLACSRDIGLFRRRVS